MHYVILGNGIVALSTAYRLARWLGDQDSITVIGPPARTGSATLAAAAMLNSFAEIESGALEHPVDLYRFELSHLATRMWPRFERELIDAAGSRLPKACASCSGFCGGGCADTGTYVVNNTAADDLDDENYDAILRALRDFDEPHEEVAPSSIPNYQPAQSHRATRALLIHGEGWFNPRLIIEKLDAILDADPRVASIPLEATSVLHRQGLISGVALADGRVVSGDRYLVATGASAARLLETSGLDLPMQRVFHGVGVSIEIKSNDSPHTHCIRTPNRGLACGIYSVPYYLGPGPDAQHVLIGASNFMSPEPYAHGRLTSVVSLMQAAIEQINTAFYRADLVRVNVGWRPTSQDTYPMIGPTSVSNLWVATGTKRDGFHMAPLLSDLLADMMLGLKVDEAFDVFRPERAPISTLSREQAIDKAVRHQMSAAYQHGFKPSHNRMPEQVARMFRDDLNRLHDQVGAEDWGIPPEMLDMYRYGHARHERDWPVRPEQ